MELPLSKVWTHANDTGVEQGSWTIILQERSALFFVREWKQCSDGTACVDDILRPRLGLLGPLGERGEVGLRRFEIAWTKEHESRERVDIVVQRNAEGYITLCCAA